MPPKSDNKNRYLSRISVAGATLAHPKNVEFLTFFAKGLSIRARARLALAAAFLVAAPTLFIGVMRTEEVEEHAVKLNQYDDYWKRLLETRIAIKDLDLSIWSYMVEREFENGQAVLAASENVKQAINHLVTERPMDLDMGPKGYFSGLAIRLDSIIKRSVANRGSMAQARLGILSLSKELKIVEKRVVEIAHYERKESLRSLSMVGRDQLVLFLILLFALPVFVGFIPSWLVRPLSRLKQIASKIELGQLKAMPVSGHDEVALLARSLKSFFLRKEDLDQKKSSKIFEMRNILRSVINRVKEPIFIVDENTRINYTNDAAVSLMGLPSHQMEGKIISDCMYSPAIKKAVEKAFSGEIAEVELQAGVEVADGRTFLMQTKIGVVRNRDGEISRAVVVLTADNLPEKDQGKENFGG